MPLVCVCLLFFTIKMRLMIWGKNTTEMLLLSCHLKFGCMIAVCLIIDFPGSTLGFHLPMQETQEIQVQSLGWKDPIE